MSRLLLAYSAFECLLRIIDVKLSVSGGLLSDEDRARIHSSVSRLSGQAEVLSVVRSQVDKRFQRQIDHHLQGRAANPFYLAAAIRHSFAHGHLTPNPAGVPPRSVATVSRYLTGVLFKVMDREFEVRMNELEGILASR